jgi:hypothetical protein
MTAAMVPQLQGACSKNQENSQKRLFEAPGAKTPFRDANVNNRSPGCFFNAFPSR